MSINLKRNLGIGMAAVFGIAIFFLGVSITKADYSAEIPPEKNCPQGTGNNILHFIKQTDPTRITESFPYAAFLDTASFCDIQNIQADLYALDSVFSATPNTGKELYITALTEKLEQRISSSFDKYNPDSLIALTQWVEKFDHYKDLDQANAKVYKIIYRHWMNFISNHLGKSYEDNSGVKYDFKFRFLTALCQSKKYSPPLGDSPIEKVVTYVSDQKWGYLFNRFWHGTGLVFKLVVGLGLLTTLYGFYCIIKVHFKK